MEPLLKDTDVAKYLNDVTPKTLERWRADNEGPKFIRVGRQVRYRPEDVRAWLEERTSA